MGSASRSRRGSFPELTEIFDSALYKSSPFHKLTQEQIAAKNEILETLYDKLHQNEEGNLIVVSGEAGSGKTVLLSSLFYDIFQNPIPEGRNSYRDLDCHLLVNHEEQNTVYTQIAEKLGIHTKNNPTVRRPTNFINNYSPDRKADVVLIDEAICFGHRVSRVIVARISSQISLSVQR